MNYYVQLNSSVNFVISILLTITVGILLLNKVDTTPRGLLRKLCEIAVFLVLSVVTSCILLAIFDANGMSSYIRFANKLAIVIVLGIYAVFFSKYRSYAKITIISILFAVQTYADMFSLFFRSANIFQANGLLLDYVSSAVFATTIILTGLFIKRFTINTSEKVPHIYWLIVVLIGIASELCFDLLKISFSNVADTFAADTYGKTFLAAILYLFNLLTFYLFYALTTAYNNSMEIEALRRKQLVDIEETEHLSRTYEELRILRHEFKNNMLSLKILLETGKSDKLKNYIGKYINEYEQVLKSIDSGNEVVNKILNYKNTELSSAGMDFTVNAKLPETLPFEENDITSLLVNLIDNAVEGASKTEKPSVSLNMQIERSYCLITVANPVNGDILADNPELTTTKPDKSVHGVGLKVVQSIVQKYNGHIKFEQENSSFIASLMLALT